MTGTPYFAAAFVLASTTALPFDPATASASPSKGGHLRRRGAEVDDAVDPAAAAADDRRSLLTFPDPIDGAACMEQASGIDLGCTAQDIKFDRVTGFDVLGGPDLLKCNCSSAVTTPACATEHDVDCGEYDLGTVFGACNGGNDNDDVVVQMNVDFLVSTTRYDIGMYIATDGGSALDGEACHISALQYGTYGDVQVWEVEGDASSPNPAPDNCYDLGSTGVLTDYPFAPVTLSCTDSNDDGLLDFDIGIVWSVQKGAYDCDIDDLDKRPVASSSPKCWYDENFRASIPIYVPPEPIVIVETAPPTLSPVAPPVSNTPQLNCADDFNLCFALDMSGSVCNGGQNINCNECQDSQCQDDGHTVEQCCANFEKVRQFAADVASSLDEHGVGAVGTSVVEFATGATTASFLTTNVTETLIGLDGMVYTGGWTDHSDAITVCGATFPESGEGSKNIIVLVTDGVATRPATSTLTPDMAALAAATVAKDAGTAILPVFISDSNSDSADAYMTELSSDGNVYNVGDFEGLNGVIGSLVDRVLCVGAIAVGDYAETPMNVAVQIDVLPNDVGNGTLRVIPTTGLVPSNGVVYPVDGPILMSVNYMPDPDFVGTDTFEYEMCDSNDECDTALVTVEVLSLPVAIDDSATTTMNTPINIDVLPNDVHDDTASITAVTQPVGEEVGAVAIVPGMVSYDPPTGFLGTETFTYTICQSSDDECDTATVTVDVLRAGPDAIDDSAETTMQVPVTIPVLDNDVSDGPLVVDDITDQPSNGTVFSGGTLGGNVVYYPEDGFQGTDTFTYAACDAWDQCDEAVVAVVVGPPAIVAIDDRATTPHETPVTIDVLANDQGAELEAKEIPTGPPNGEASIQEDGTVAYTPDHLFFGNDTFTYKACEAADDTVCDTATVTVHVPIPAILAVDDSTSTPEETPVDILVLVNDIGEGLTVQGIHTPPQNGGVQIDGDMVVYTPAENFDGVDTFVYQACNGDSQCDTATVTVTVPDDPIEAVDDSTSTPKDTPVTIPVLDNDQGEELTVRDIPDDPDHGVAQIRNDEVFYIPDNDDYTGPDVFTYTACIGDSEVCDTATVTVNVEEPAIETIDDAATTTKNIPVDIPVLTNDHGEDLTLDSFPEQPENGAVDIDNNQVVYTPNADYTGPDTFTYSACNGDSAVCDTATVTVTVEEPPIEANNDSATTPKRAAVTISVLPNDLGENLIVQDTTQPSNGAVEIVGEEVVYTPDPDFDGQDAFTYEACTGGDVVECDIATVVVTVEPPVIDAVDDTTSTRKDTPVDVPVLVNDVGDQLTIDPDFPDQPDNGAVEIENDAIVYTPDDEYVGQDTFTYRACLGDTDDCDTATVTVVVEPPPVVAIDDSATTPKRTPVTIPVLANDIGDPIAVHETIPDQPAHGTVTVEPGFVVYTPAGDYTGTDTFTYQACVWNDDVYGECDTATVTVDVQNQPPVANPDTVQMGPEDGPMLTIDVLANDDDPNDDPLSVGVGEVTEPDHGFVGICGDSQCVTYTPFPGFSGEDAFEYLACDTDSSCDAAQVTVIVNPDAVDDAESDLEGAVITKDVLENDVGTDLVVEFVAPAANGVCAITANGSLQYTPDDGFVGQDQCMYTACTSGTAACDTARLILDVIAEPTYAPSAMPSAPPTEAWYYPDWIHDSQVCLNDYAEPEYMLEVQRKNYLYRSKELCCQNHFWWRITQCMANEHPMYYSTGDKCDQKVFFEFHESKFTPADWSSSDLFETLEQCCTHKFGWDVHGCMAKSPRELKYYFSVDVQHLLEPAFCQDADIVANALGVALEMGFDDDMTANITSIGCATLSRNPDTGNPECGGCLAGSDFLGGTDGQTVINDATGVVTTVTVEIRKKFYGSTTEDVAELTDYITDLLQGFIPGSLTPNIQTWSRDRIPSVGQLFDSVVDPDSFTFLNVIDPFAPRDTKYYPDWVQEKTCVNDGLEPPYMKDSPDDYLFDTASSCCDIYFTTDTSCGASASTSL